MGEVVPFPSGPVETSPLNGKPECQWCNEPLPKDDVEAWREHFRNFHKFIGYVVQPAHGRPDGGSES